MLLLVLPGLLTKFVPSDHDTTDSTHGSRLSLHTESGLGAYLAPWVWQEGHKI